MRRLMARTMQRSLTQSSRGAVRTVTIPLLDIRNLTFAVGDQKILDQLNLTIHPREIHALLGANGSGKTTLAYLLMGCDGYLPTQGTIRFAGVDLLPLKMHERRSWA